MLHLTRLLGLHREHDPPPHRPESGLARHPRAGCVKVLELLADLQAQHEKATTRAGELRDTAFTGPSRTPSTSTPTRSSDLSCTNSSACPSTRRRSMSPVLTSDTSSVKASPPSPDEATTRNGLNFHSEHLSFVRQEIAMARRRRRADRCRSSGNRSSGMPSTSTRCNSRSKNSRS